MDPLTQVQKADMDEYDRNVLESEVVTDGNNGDGDGSRKRKATDDEEDIEKKRFHFKQVLINIISYWGYYNLLSL